MEYDENVTMQRITARTYVFGGLNLEAKGGPIVECSVTFEDHHQAKVEFQDEHQQLVPLPRGLKLAYDLLAEYGNLEDGPYLDRLWKDRKAAS